MNNRNVLLDSEGFPLSQKELCKQALEYNEMKFMNLANKVSHIKKNNLLLWGQDVISYLNKITKAYNYMTSLGFTVIKMKAILKDD